MPLNLFLQSAMEYIFCFIPKFSMKSVVLAFKIPIMRYYILFILSSVRGIAYTKGLSKRPKFFLSFSGIYLRMFQLSHKNGGEFEEDLVFIFYVTKFCVAQGCHHNKILLFSHSGDLDSGKWGLAKWPFSS